MAVVHVVDEHSEAVGLRQLDGEHLGARQCALDLACDVPRQFSLLFMRAHAENPCCCADYQCLIAQNGPHGPISERLEMWFQQDSKCLASPHARRESGRYVPRMREPLPAPLPFRLEDARPLLGRLLVDRGLLTLEQLEESLVEKESTGARLGEIVVARGWLSETDVAHALAEQHELEFIELSKTEVDASAALLLPEKFARRYGALPICFLDDDSVLVAIADPTNVLTSDDLRLAFGLNVKLARLPPRQPGKTIARVYRSELDLDQPFDEEPEDDAVPTVTDIREGPATSAP